MKVFDFTDVRAKIVSYFGTLGMLRYRKSDSGRIYAMKVGQVAGESFYIYGESDSLDDLWKQVEKNVGRAIRVEPV